MGNVKSLRDGELAGTPLKTLTESEEPDATFAETKPEVAGEFWGFGRP